MARKNTVLDHDVLSRVLSVIDRIKMLKLAAEHGANVSFYSYDVIDESNFLDQMLMDMMYGKPEIFGCEIEDIDANDPEWEGAKYFQDMCEWFPYNEITVSGILFVDDILYRFYEICKENHIDIGDTAFTKFIIDASKYVNNFGDEYTYMEIFIPNDDVIEKLHAPLIMFFTDGTLINYSMLDYYYQAYDFAKRVVDGEVNLILKGVK